MNARDAINLATLGALVVGGVIVYRKVTAVTEGLNKVGSAIGTGAADFVDFVKEKIGGPAMSMTFYAMHFANGVKHAIPNKSREFPDGVDDQGRFTYKGKKFVTRIRVLPDGTRQHWAFNP